MSRNPLLLLITLKRTFLVVFNGSLQDKSENQKDWQRFVESKVGVTYVFPLDENQILWWRSSIVAWYGNGLSIRGYQAPTRMHCNTKSGSMLLFSKQTVPPPGKEDANLHCSCSWWQPSEQSNMCFPYLGFCSGEFERIQPLMFQQSCVTVTVLKKKNLCHQRNVAGIKSLKELVGSTYWADVVSFDDWLIIWSDMSWWRNYTSHWTATVFHDTLGTCAGAQSFPSGSVCQLDDRGARSVSTGSSSPLFCLDGIIDGTTLGNKNEGRVEVEERAQWHNLFICGVGVGRKSSGEKTDGRGQRREARNWGLHAPATFSLRFFAKWAEQKAEVRFLPFQCDEDGKWQNLNTDQVGPKVLLDQRTAMKMLQSGSF